MLAGTTIRFVVAIATAVTFMGIAAACGGDDDAGDDLPPPAPAAPTPEPSPSLHLSPAEQQAVDEARATFDEFMNAYVKVSTAEIPTAQTAEGLFRQVDEHLAGLLSQELRQEIVGRWSAQETVTGDLTWRLVRVLDVELDREVDGESFPQVNLAYCIDVAGWSAAEASDAKQTWRYALSWNDDWFGQGIEGWRVVERERVAAEPC